MVGGMCAGKGGSLSLDIAKRAMPEKLLRLKLWRSRYVGERFEGRELLKEFVGGRVSFYDVS